MKSIPMKTSLLRVHSFLKTSLGIPAAIALFALPAAWANTNDNIVAGAVDLGINTTATYTTAPVTTANDITFATATTYANASNILLNNAALSVGTLNDLNATAITINGNKLLTLNFAANSVSGNASDLIYVASGGSLTVNDSAGITFLPSGNVTSLGTLNLGTTPLTITAGTTLTFAGAGTTTVGGNIAATTGAVAVNAASGTVILSGTNSYTGNTTLTAGTLQLNNASNGGLGSAGTLSLSGGTLQSLQASQGISNAVTLAAGSTVSGAQSITFNGALTQSASSTLFSSISGGNTLTLAGNVNIDAVTGTALTLTIAGTGNTTISGVIQDYSGGVGTVGGKLAIANSGTVATTGTTTLLGTNTYKGTTTVSAGTLVIGSTGVLGSGGGTAITVNGGTLTDNATTNGITGTSSLAVSSGTATLANANNYSGATAVSSSGTLQLKNASSMATSALTLSGGALQLRNDTDNTTFTTASTTVSGNTAINVDQSTATNTGKTLKLGNIGTAGNMIVVTNGNTYNLALGTVTSSAGPTFYNNMAGGTLTLGALTLTPASAQTATFNGNSSTATTSVGVISQNGANALGVTQSGNGTLVLTGATYTGTTTVNSGKVQLNETGSTTVLNTSSPLTLGGGSLYVQATNAGAFTQTVGTFTLTAGGITLANAGTTTGTSLTTTGALTAPTNTSGTVLTLNLANAGTGALTLGTTTAAAFAPWAVVTDSTTSGFGTINGSSQLVRYTGGTALASNSGTNTINYTSTPTDAAYSGGTLTMAAASGALNSLFINSGSGGTLDLGTNNVTVSVAQNALGMAGSGNYTISGGILKASFTTTALTVTNAGTGTLTINSLINNGGSGGLFKAGTGTLALAGTQSFTGATTVNQGTLQFNTANFSPGSAITVNSAGTVAFGSGIGTFNVTKDITGSGTLSLTDSASNPVTLNVASGKTVTLGATITGTGGITNSGTLTITGYGSSYSGGVTLNPGSYTSVNLANASTSTSQALGTGLLTLNNGTLYYNTYTSGGQTILNLVPNILFSGDFAFTNGFSSGGSVDLGGATRTITSTAGGSVGFAGVITNGGIVAAGVKGLSLNNAANTFAGGVTIAPGSMLTLVGTTYSGSPGAVTAGTLGTGTLTIGSGATLFHSNAATIGNNVAVTGDFITNSNLLTLVGAVDLGGANRTITVQSTNGTAINGRVTNGGIILAGVAGGFSLNNATNNFTGGVTVGPTSSLTITGNSSGSPGSPTSGPLGTGTLTINGGSITQQYPAAIYNDVVINNDFTVTSDNGSRFGGTVSVGSGTPTITPTSTFSSLNFVLGTSVQGTGGVTFGGNNAASFTRTVTYSGASANTYSGLTTMAMTGGTGNVLSLSKTAGVNAIAGDLLITAGTVSYGASNQIANTSAVSLNGSTAVFALGANSDTVGTVTLDGLGSITSSTGVLTGSSYKMNSGTVSAILGGTGIALTKSTSGTVTLSGVNTYTGAA